MLIGSSTVAGSQVAFRFLRPSSKASRVFPCSYSIRPLSPVLGRRRRYAPYIQSAVASTMAPRTSVAEFQELVGSGSRILALCGAGLSAASGLPTFRGAGGLWRNHEATSLASPDAFRNDPALVWLFYSWRRHMALKAKPNRGHYALAELAKKKDEFMCLTQNVDGEFGLRTAVAFR